MDDIYDDLDNYEDLNIVEDLKKENHDLKLKLEEYTIAMSKLQKDFDKLSSDFKKLEMNYSSLLKTAKVEIERKTKIITDLNIEKDMIVLNALQNRNGNDVRTIKNITKPLMKGPSNNSSLGKARSNVALADNNKGNNNCGRKEDVRFSSVETTTTSGHTDIATKLMQFANKNSENIEQWSDRTSDTKENMAQRSKNVENNKSASTHALSIKNRRKSMPAARSQAKYSSDEECEDSYCSNDVNRISSKEDPNRQNIDKLHSDRHRFKGLEERNKSSEISNVDDKYYGFHESSRETGNKQTYHRSRNDRHYGIEKHRSRNKYDTSLRHRRHFSPERSRRASRNDEYQRHDYGRFRVLESPPPEKFQHYQSRNQETRFKRDRDDTYDLDKRDNRYDKYSLKHKTTSEHHYDEPISKRKRTDSINKFSEEDTRWSRERPVENPVLDLYENFHQDLSCQSPDYIMSDAVSSYPVREIMNTASTPLEDPRIHSKRYILKTSDDNVALSTVIGRNVDLKILDTSHWNDTPAKVPKNLTRRPSQYSEDIVKEIYMDMDNPVSNMSTESGEILSFDVEDHTNEVRNVPNIQRYEPNIENDSATLPDKNGNKKGLTKYKIPKVNKNVSENKLCASHIDRQSQKKAENPIKILKEVTKDQIEKESIAHMEIQTFRNNENCAAHYKDINRESTSSMKELVAGDLELSDETCDTLEIKKTTTIDKSQNKDEHITHHENKDKTTSPLQNEVTSQDIILDKNIEKKIIKEKSPCDTVHDESRKRNSKKKLPKNNETPIIPKVNTTEKETTKKTKSKKETKDPKEIKTKFSELFGDNSSLITPEDLGIMAIQAQTQASASYVPICENAQDAVDVTVSNVEKVQTRLSKLKSLETLETKECLEADYDGQKIAPKTQSKSSNSTKKKTRKNSAELTGKSRIREVYQSLTADKLVTENVSSQNLMLNDAVKQVASDPAADEPQQIVTIAQERSHTDAENFNFSESPQLVDKDIVTPPNIDMVLKPNILMSALATSTPQKELQQDNSGIGVVVGQAAICLSSSKETSNNYIAADKSSSNETLNSQKDTDVPDVRIFVRRKRKVKIPKPLNS